LSTSKTRRIGIVVGELTNPFYAALVDPIVHELGKRGYLGVLLYNDDAHEPTDAAIFDGSFDGVLLAAVSDNRLPQELEQRGIPYCMLNREIQGRREISASVPDNLRGSELVAGLLANLGHTEIGVISGPTSTTTGSERLRGFRDSLARRNIAVHPESIRKVPFTIEDGCRAAREILGARPNVTALFCANDLLAIGALEAAALEMRPVPQSLTIVGFDNISLARLRAFNLTTVAVDLSVLARQATMHLLDRVDDPSIEPLRIVHDVQLILRGTHSAPPLR